MNRHFELDYAEYFELKQLCKSIPDSYRISLRENYFKIFLSAFCSIALTYAVLFSNLQSVYKAEHFTLVLKRMPAFYHIILGIATLGAIVFFFLQRTAKVENKASKVQLLNFFEHVERRNLGLFDLKILHAAYGGNDNYLDKTQDIRNRVGKNGIDFHLRPGIFYDHVPNIPKTLTIQFLYMGEIDTMYFEENSHVLLPRVYSAVETPLSGQLAS